jgi:opacity protein-like surface antigen
MKRGIPALCLLGLAVLASPPEAAATTVDEALARGRIELGTAVSLSNTKESGDDESITILNVPFRVGWMLTDRLQLEGEVLLSHLDFGDDDSQTGVIGAGHLLYHFPVSGSTALYLLGGAGYGNATDLLGFAAEADENVALYRGGAGLKAFVSRNVALRVEYRFTRSHGGQPESEFREALRLNDHKVLVGISLWLR